MPRDERDDPNMTTDVNGDYYYTAKDGHRIMLDDPKQGYKLKELEDHLASQAGLSMGMK